MIGYGAIGSRVAQMIRGSGCHVLVYDAYITAEALGKAAEKIELAELLARPRVASQHARATIDNKGMIGAAELAATLKDSVFINCARLADVVRYRLQRARQ